MEVKHILYIFLFSIIAFLIYKCIFLYKKTINERINYLLKNKDVFILFYNLSLISSSIVALYLIIHFCCYLVNETLVNKNISIIFHGIIYMLMIVFILIYIFFLYPHVRKTEEYIEIGDLYNNEIVSCKMFFEGYKNYRYRKIHILSLTIDINHTFSYNELVLLYDFLVKLRCIYSDIKSIFWFPEIIFITFMIYVTGDNYLKQLSLLIIFILICIFIFRLYFLQLLFLYFNKPIKILLSKSQRDFIDFYIDQKLRRILHNIDKDGLRLPMLKLIKEFVPIIGN